MLIPPEQFKQQVREDNERYIKEFGKKVVDRAWDISRTMKRGYIDRSTCEMAQERIKEEMVENLIK